MEGREFRTESARLARPSVGRRESVNFTARAGVHERFLVETAVYEKSSA